MKIQQTKMEDHEVVGVRDHRRRHPLHDDDESTVLTNKTNTSSIVTNDLNKENESWHCSACDYRNLDIRTNPYCSICGTLTNHKQPQKQQLQSQSLRLLSSHPLPKQQQQQQFRSKSTGDLTLVQDPYYNMLDTSVLKPTRTSKNFNDDENNRSKSLPTTGLFDYALELQEFLQQHVVDDCCSDNKNDNGSVQSSLPANNIDVNDHEKENQQTGEHDHDHYGESSSSWICQVCTFQNYIEENNDHFHPYLTCLMCGQEQESDDDVQELEQEYYQDLISLQEERMRDFQQETTNTPLTLPLY